MATTTSSLIVKIGANADQYEEELQKVSKTTKNLEKNLAKVAQISGAAFAGGTIAIIAATKAASDFEDKFSDVVTLLDKGSFSTKSLEQGIEGLKKGVIELGQESGESFESLNKALFDLISSGVPAEEAIDTLRVTTELAAAGATDTATAVKALTATITAFGDEAGTAQEISEKFFIAQKFGVTTVGALATEFNKVAGVAKNLNISFDETLASLSALTADGAKPTALAATQLKAAFSGIINVQQTLSSESLEVQKALSLQNLEQKGLIGSLDDLKAATGGNIAEMKRLLGSSEALGAVLSLTGAQSELVKKQMREMADEQARAATFAEALATKQETTKKAMERFSRVMESAAIIIGEQFAPILSKAADLLGAFFKILINNPVLSKTAALVLGLGTALAGIAAAGALAATAFLKIRAAMVALSISTKVLAIGVKGLVGATGLGLLLIIASEIFNNWSTVWPATVKIFAAVVKTLKNLASGIGDILTGIFTLDSDKIASGIEKTKKATIDGLKDITEAVKGEKEKQKEDDSDLEELKAKEDAKTTIALEKKRERDEALLESDREFAAAKAEQDAEIREEQAALDEELATLTAEQKAAFTEKELTDLRAQVMTKKEIENDAAKKKLKKQIDDRNQFLKDEQAHGTAVATVRQVLRSDEVKNASIASRELVGLQQSENDTLKGIGKAAAATQIAIDTARGATAAYAALAGIPIVGPGLGLVAAGAIVAFGAEKTSKVLAANRGGQVPKNLGIPGQDSVSATLTPGELIVPERSFDEVVNSVASQRSGERISRETPFETGEDESNNIVLEIELKERAGEVISLEQREGKSLGLISRND